MRSGYFSGLAGISGRELAELREDGSCEDDPENGIFWGPKQPNGMRTRWSRSWFDWRSERSMKN
jgi:hypothetical protein